jgi:asparagine synthase (glutamine-hydrolysing)
VCGIAGFFDPAGAASADELRARALQMAAALAHRGPDDSGAWVDERCGIALGHRRLSIIDLSPLGHQPMTSESGRFVISYNGEIYNYRELRAELEPLGARMSGQSDTAVLLAAVERWGFEQALKRFNGMFAIALWDREERQLLLARDRFGEKPLYYGVTGKTLYFASELKGLRAHPSFHDEVDRASLAQFLRFTCVPAPRSILQHVRKLPAGCWMAFGARAEELRPPTPYWSMVEVALAGEKNRFKGSEEDAVGELDRVLRASIRARMVADVPLGVFLSGGIDSSTVVALMQAQSARPIRTFTIGFKEATFNEAKSAKAVAKHLHTEHTELYVTPEQARGVIPKLPVLYDEPFADASQIPTFLVAQLARRDVTVALTGDGGDELFGGYNRHRWAEPLWRWLAPLPLRGRRLAAAAIDLAEPEWIDRYAGIFDRWLPEALRHRMPGEKMQKIAEALRVFDREALLLRLLSAWQDPSSVVGVDDPMHPFLDGERPPLRDFTERMMCTDALLYLPDDILVKVDRATMGVSLESRAPMLDPEVAALASSLPMSFKVRGLQGKRVLKKLLAKYVPNDLFERPKMGFGVPIGDWLRGPLRAWAEAELDEGKLRQTGYFKAEPIRKMWRQHCDGHRNLEAELWPVLMFQAWHEEWESPRPRASRGPSLPILIEPRGRYGQP